jgi:hypothetical protein
VTDKWQTRPLVGEGAQQGQLQLSNSSKHLLGIDTKTQRLTDSQSQRDLGTRSGAFKTLREMKWKEGPSIDSFCIILELLCFPFSRLAILFTRIFASGSCQSEYKGIKGVVLSAVPTGTSVYDLSTNLHL